MEQPSSLKPVTTSAASPTSAIPEHSCVDCTTRACLRGGTFPAFCTTQKLEQQQIDDAKAGYEADDEATAIMQVATRLSDECMHKQWPRIRATVEFAKRMGYQRLGICTCIGFVAESHQLADRLRKEGFEVFGVACKIGQIPGSEIGFNEPDTTTFTCNPLMQAQLLNDAKTNLNIVLGLCIGHDIVFSKYSDAPVSTFMTKDPAMKPHYHFAFEAEEI